MSRAPLSHHELLKLVEPFSRAGRHVDLGACDRLERRIAFQAVEHASPRADEPPLRETLRLEQLPTGTFHLTRTMTEPGGLEATLSAFGARPADLLASFQTVQAGVHFRVGTTYTIARSYEFPPFAETRAGLRASSGAPPVIFTGGVALVGDVELTLLLPGTRGVPAHIGLKPLPGVGSLDLPEDLLAVLGWDWVRLFPDGDGWKTKLRLRGGQVRRSRAAEHALARAASHLAQTFAEPPARFHERWRLARWAAVFRRTIPILTLVLLALVVSILPRILPHPKPGVEVFIFYIPVILIVWSFCLQEQARYEIPPLPRPPKVSSWRRPPPA